MWRACERELERCNAWSFDDLLVFAVRLLREQPQRLTHLRARWRWLVVDELQDTNEAQAALLELLAGPTGNLTAVGDDDQLIYRFRCAEPRNILRFGERYPGHRQIVLGANFRSRAEILHAAVACVSHNPQRTAKALRAVRGAGGQLELAGLRRRARRGGVGRGADRRRARGRSAAGGDPRARAHRLRARTDPARARRGRDPAPRARQPRSL